MSASDGNVARATPALGVTRETLYERLRGIAPDK